MTPSTDRWITNHKNVYDFKLDADSRYEQCCMKEFNASTRKDNRSKEYSCLMLQILTVHFGTIFGSEITKHWGEQALEDDTYVVKCNGAGGQSLRSLHSKRSDITVSRRQQ